MDSHPPFLMANRTLLGLVPLRIVFQEVFPLLKTLQLLQSLISNQLYLTRPLTLFSLAVKQVQCLEGMN